MGERLDVRNARKLPRGRGSEQLDTQPEARARPQHDRVEADGEEAAGGKRRPKAEAKPKQGGNEQEHRQRRKHEPERRLGVGSHGLDVRLVAPQGQPA